ncbi:MAG: acyltransferase domain-containing protein [Chitinivibrionales bacterium]|nr:acyltransferase domain-containing protein [Chitinivibrionales bacterium]MBD3357091.1 acyltransferase domain-containing protein [Chitinivibrionales bacterium]
MNKNVVFMFSGQGAQYYRMAEELYKKYDRFAYWMDHCNEMAAPYVGNPLTEVIYEGGGKSEPFDRLLYTNPALLCVQYSLAQVLLEEGVKPDYLLGYSLGEIVASVVARAISLESGIELVTGLARLVEDKTPPAEMLAIMAPFPIVSTQPAMFRSCWVTGKNMVDNFVVCGEPETIRNLCVSLKKQTIAFQKLPVKFGFHTEMIDPIEGDFRRLVKRIEPGELEIPVISAYQKKTVTTFGADYLWNVIRCPVDFEATVKQTLRMDDFLFIDAGPSGVLATLVKYLLPADAGSVSLQMINQFGNDMHTFRTLMQNLNAERVY